jgi:uncharacterized membrane protein
LQLKDAGFKHWKQVHDSEVALDKAKNKYESLSEDWERALLNKDQAAAAAAAENGHGAYGGTGQYASGGAGNSGTLRRGSAAGMTKSLSNPMQLWMQSSNNPGKVCFAFSPFVS